MQWLKAISYKVFIISVVLYLLTHHIIILQPLTWRTIFRSGIIIPIVKILSSPLLDWFSTFYCDNKCYFRKCLQCRIFSSLMLLKLVFVFFILLFLFHLHLQITFAHSVHLVGKGGFGQKGYIWPESYSASHLSIH